jgi:diguanylate cyclase (GGDEF)-like protein
MMFPYVLAAAPTAAVFASGYLAGCRRGCAQLGRVKTALAAERLRAGTDPLTGLANRAGLTSELGQRAPRGNLAVLLVDLDDFKVVNDTLGHASGDVVLVEVAERLATLVAGDGMAARLGGDEFVLLAPSPSPVISRLLAYDVRRTVARPIDIDGRFVTVHASVGVVHGLAGDSPRALLHAADIAMYQAKGEKTGRAGVVEYDPCAQPAAVTDRRPLLRQRELATVMDSLMGVA